MKRSSGHAILIVVIIIAALAILGLLGWLFWRNIASTPNGSAITNFEQCKQAPGSLIQETFPERCVTSDGQIFTGPGNPDIQVTTITYCTEAEELCFDYPDSWTLKELELELTLEGAEGDRLELRPAGDGPVLVLESGIGGLGGVCDEAAMKPVTVLSTVPMPEMTGFADEYSLDMLQVTRAVYTNSDNAYVAAIYVTDSEEYTTPGRFDACGIGYSQFMNGRNARISGDSDQAGAFYFGYTGHSTETAYSTLEEAEEIYNTPIYQEAATILASLRYE